LPVSIPDISVDRVTLSTSPVELPVVGAKVSQSALLLTDQCSVPPSEFQILNVQVGGLEFPCSAVMLKLDGPADRIGWVVSPQPISKLMTSKMEQRVYR